MKLHKKLHKIIAPKEIETTTKITKITWLST